jgi:hypothetical protein
LILKEGEGMPNLKIVALGSLACLALAGCNTVNTPIVAGAYDTVGLSVSGGPQEQGGSFVFGYKGGKFAVVPVESSNGNTLLLTNKDGGQRGFSVFAMLGVDSKGGAATGIGLEQVVAVGPAAEIWAARAPGVVVTRAPIQPVP